jgi:hypothetical protein
MMETEGKSTPRPSATVSVQQHRPELVLEGRFLRLIKHVTKLGPQECSCFLTAQCTIRIQTGGVDA